MVRTSVKWPFCTTSVGLLFSCARVVPPTNNHTSKDTPTRGQSFLLLTRLRTTPLSPVLRLPSRKRSCTAAEDEGGGDVDMRRSRGFDGSVAARLLCPSKYAISH